MKTRLFFVLAMLILLNACTIEKRHCRKGYYFHFNQKYKTINAINESENTSTEFNETIVSPIKNEISLNTSVEKNFESEKSIDVTKPENNYSSYSNFDMRLNDKIVFNKENITSHFKFDKFIDKMNLSKNREKDGSDYYSKLAKISFYLMIIFIFIIAISLIIGYFTIVFPPSIVGIIVLTSLVSFFGSFILSISSLKKIEKDNPSRKFAVISLIFCLLALITLGIFIILALMMVI